jgi:hypothetical protein
MRNTSAQRPALTTATRVTFTALPFGGAVLVDGSTLAVVECGDGDREGDAALIEELVAEGWLVPRARADEAGEPENAEGGRR